MPSAAASAILEGVPEAADLRVLRSGGVTRVFAGKTALFWFADGDAAMRNIAVAALRQIGFPGTQVAAALGLTTNYVATLHQRARREGTAGLVRPRGRPRTVTDQDWEQARAWRAAGVRDAEIARRLGVQQSTVLRRLGPAQVQGELEPQGAAACGPAAAGREGQPPGPEPEAVPGQDEQEPEQPEPAPRPEPGVVPPGFARAARAAEGSGMFSRYAGAMLLHAYPGQAGEILPESADGHARDAALLSAVSMGFALGAATAEQVKHLARRKRGRWPGWPCCRRCGRCARGWPRSPTPPARWSCRRHSRRRCWRRTPRRPGCTTSMTTSSRTRARNRSARAGTTSGAGRRGAARTRT